MKKASLLIALIAFVIWLAHGTTKNTEGKSVIEAPSPPAVAYTDCGTQQSCCLNPNETDPHWECWDGACYCMSGCGSSVDCLSCGCDPYEEWACIGDGGYWDPFLCMCEYGCDSDGSQQAYCFAIGGTWDPFSCTCQVFCNPGPEVTTYQYGPYDCSYCWGSDYYGCSCVDYELTRFCQNGSVYSQRWQTTEACSVWPYGCGGGGGG